MEKEKLTERQQEVYDFIVSFTEKHLFPPSFEEIAANTKVSVKSEAKRLVGVLERKGYLDTTPNTPRGISLKGYKLVKEPDHG